MRRHFWKRKAKILVVVLAATMGIGGLATEARAFLINSGDLVLAVYGNNQEYYQNLGSAAAALTPGGNVSFNLNQSTLSQNLMATLSGAPGNPVAWTLVRTTFGTNIPAPSLFMNAGSQLTAQETLDAGNSFSVSQASGAIRTWISALSPISSPLANQILLLANDPASFTSTMGLGGSLAGTFTGFGMEGSLGNTLTILQGVVAGNAISDAGRAILMADGQFALCGGAGCTPAPVPVPAAAVLFATGLIGMVGIVRRKLRGRGNAD